MANNGSERLSASDRTEIASVSDSTKTSSVSNKRKALPLLAPKAFAAFANATEWLTYVRSLIIVKDLKEAKSVPGVGIVFKANNTRVTIRVKRDPKIVKRDEITKLAIEYGKPELDILALFRKRKLEVSYEQSDVRAHSDALHFDSLRKRKPKGNVKPRRTRKRKATSADQLLEPGRDPQLHEKS